MKLTPTTSPVLQHFLTPGYDSPESYFNTDEDIHCPQAVTEGLNARSSGCVARLTQPTVDKCCRQCETGREILARVNPDAVILKTMCACGINEAAEGFSSCQVCIDKSNRYYQQRNPAKQRYCKRCNDKVGMRVHYCLECRPIVDEELRVKRNKYKVRQKLIARQAKIEKKLAEL